MLLLIYAAAPLSGYEFITTTAGTKAAPVISLTEINPSDGSGFYYLTCAAKTANDKPTAQFSGGFTIKNNEGKALVLNDITYYYMSNGKKVSKKMVLDIDDEKKKTITIAKNASFSWQNSRDYHQVDNAIQFNSPFPSSITIQLSFDGYSEPYEITRTLKSYSNQAPGGAYNFPGKESDLQVNEYWYSYGGHGGGGQFYAYDFKVIGWDSKNKKWSNTFPGTDGSKNEHYLAYGKAIIAAGDGKVIDFEEGVTENKGNAGGGSGGGNWIKINNGKETLCYYHMQKGSLTKSLLKKGAEVKKGDKLGLLGNSGSSSEPHGHVHAIDDPDADGQGDWRPLNLNSIYIIDKDALSKPDPGAAWEKVEKQGLPFLEGRRCMIWPGGNKPCWYPRGKAEIAKHGIAESNYQEEIEKIWGCGYYPIWVDAYDVKGKTFFNAIFRYNSAGYDVVVRHDMTAKSYQKEYDDWVGKKKYCLQQIDSYNDNGDLKFAAVFIRKPGQPSSQPAYHAQSPEQHQALFEKYTGQGYVPVNVSVVSVDGKKYYSAFYEKRDVGKSRLKSNLTQAEYQQEFDEMSSKKWDQVYINAYHHDKETRFSVIWYEKSGYDNMAATRKSDSDSYQEKWEQYTGSSLLTRCVTGYDENGKHFFAAHWAK